MPKRFTKVEIAREYHRQAPEAATLTLAKRMQRENPSVFPTTEHARSVLRMARGNNGSEMRKSLKPECFRPNGTPTVAPFDAIPPGKKQLGEWRALNINGPTRALIISDVHIPYHDADALRVALEDGKKHDADTIIMNGDIVDFYGLSRYEKDPRERNFPEEVRVTKGFLNALRQGFPKARIIWKEGNHEERFWSYMRRCAPDLLGLPSFTWQSCYEVDNLGIEILGEKRPIRLGKLNVIHGHEYTFAISNPVNPARGLFLRAKVHSLCGHFHQSSQHSETTLRGEVVSTFSAGALCDLHPEYRPLNNWGHGYAYVEVDKQGSFEVENRRVINGRAY